jgi:hypothetical protein
LLKGNHGIKSVRIEYQNPCTCTHHKDYLAVPTPLVVAIEEIIGMQQRRIQIVQTPLDNIVFTKDGKIVDIDESVRDKFEMTGMSNIDFITSGEYLRKPE